MRVITFVSSLMLLAGCGRYIPPIPPESLAPKAVQGLVVTPSAQGVQFAWTAADQDRRGKELKSADGFSIERKEIARRGDETDPAVQFKELAFLKDTHVEKREELRKDARAQGKIGRTVKAPSELLSFSYLDKTPKLGTTYIYQIVPKNQGGVEGQIGEEVRIVFQGAQSAVLVRPSREMEDIATAAQLAAAPQ
jgi:hypothetical protein